MRNDQIGSLRLEIEVHVKGECVPPPILDFSNCKFDPNLKVNLEIAGYHIPTPVQMKTIPAALKRRDILVSKDTGSGKTDSFLIPIDLRCSIIRMQQLSERSKLLAMVLAPTMELYAQVGEQAKSLGKGFPFKTTLIVGGDAMPRQFYMIKHGIELIISTSGRLVDLLSKHDIELDDICMIFLDEMDCML
jgi:ATP-dependent RNA helicase DDX59